MKLKKQNSTQTNPLLEDEKTESGDFDRDSKARKGSVLGKDSIGENSSVDSKNNLRRSLPVKLKEEINNAEKANGLNKWQNKKQSEYVPAKVIKLHEGFTNRKSSIATSDKSELSMGALRKPTALPMGYSTTVGQI